MNNKLRGLFYILAILAGLGVAYGLHQAQTYMTLKAMDVTEEVEEEVLSKTYQFKKETNLTENNDSEVVVISDANPDGGMTMMPDFDESRFAPPSDSMPNRNDEKRQESANCSVDYLEGKLFVEYDGQVVKGQRVSPEGSASVEELKKIRPNLRVVEPGEMVTMDYVPDRLTIELNKMGFIERAYCG